MNGLTRWQRPDLAWPSFGRLTDLRDEIDRLFETPLMALSRSNQWFSGWNPALDLHEDKDNLYVRVELPGMKKESINLSLHDNTLSISGERLHEKKHEESEIYRSERYYGRFQRTVGLPVMVEPDKVKAQYRDGILSITLPKSEEAKPKHIDVNVS